MAEDFDVWSGRKLEQKKFAMWSDEKKAAAQNNLDSVGKMYGLHPGVGEVEKAAQSQTSAPEIKIPETPVQKPFTPVSQSARLGETNAPTKTFTFSQSPKAEVPANRFSGEGTTLPGWQAKSGMSAYELATTPLAATSSGEYTNNWNNGAPKLSGADYLDRSVNQVFLGNLTDDATLLGTAAQVGLGIAGLDLPMDIRDLTYDLTNWEWTPEHIAQTLLDAVGFIPIIGSLKYADEFAAVLKNADEVARLAREAPELVEAARSMGKLDDVLGSVDEFGELLESAPKVADLLKGKGESLTSIYRAVGPEEFYDLFDVKQFRPGPKSAAVKYFGRDFNETLKFADWTPDASAIIEVKIPQRILDEIGNLTPLDSTIFRKGTVMIQPENLDVFNKNIAGFYHVF